MFETTLTKYIKVYLTNKKLDHNNKINLEIFYHVKKSDFIVITAVNVFLIYLNILSLVISIGLFSNLSEKKLKFLLFFIRQNFLKKKVDELIFAIYFLYQENEELNIKKIDTVESTNNIVYDYIVVGSGPAGCIIANEINIRKKKVLIIEEGRSVSLPKTKHPANEFKLKWRDGGISSTLFPKQISFARGSCVGGGSEINSGLLHTPPDEFLNKSRETYKILNFDNKEINKYLDEIILKMNISTFDTDNEGCHKYFHDACRNLKYKVEVVPRLMNFDLDNDKIKRSMTNTFLLNYLSNNGKILTEHKVLNIKESNKYCTTEIVSKDQKRKIIKSKKIVLCSGSIETNKILINSNLIPKSKKKIVKHFFLHPMLKFFVEFDKKVNFKNFQDVHPYQLTEFYPDFIIGKAASNNKFKSIAAFGNDKFFEHLKLISDFISIYHITFSDGVGSLLKVPFTKKFLYNYDFSNQMNNKLKKSLDIFCSLFFSSPRVKNLYLITDKIEKLNRENYKGILNNPKILSKIKFSSVHVMGGVPFGEDKSKTIVNSNCKLHGYENIFINDSSLINEKLLKNPQGTVMALTERFIKNLDD